MGSCCHRAKKPDPRGTFAKPTIDSTKIPTFSGPTNIDKWKDEDYENFIKGILFIQEAQNFVSDISYCDDDLQEISKLIGNVLVSFNENQPSKQKQMIDKIIEMQSSTKKSGIYVNKLLPKINKQLGQTSTGMLKCAQSRTFNKVANLVRQKKQNILKEQKVHLKKFYKHVKYPYYANYPELSQRQIDDIVDLQLMEYRMQKFGDKFQFKYSGLKQQSSKIHHMLVDCFEQYKNQISSFKYTLSEKQSILAADISRRACQFHDLGIFILLMYFVRCCKKLEGQGATLKEINEKMETVLDKIKIKYPPGLKIQKNQNQFEALKKLGMQDSPVTRESPLRADKEKSLEDIIIENAEIANQYRNQFEDLLRNTCLQRCISFKTGLKLRPNHQEQASFKKAIVRIKQKMLLKDKDIQIQIKGSTIKELLDIEQKNYKNIVKKQLQNLNIIKFSVNDMLRGKCTFMSLSDIIETVAQLKNYIVQHPEEQLRIVSIQDRFSGETPISDVTLKISHQEQLASELQLSLQTNKAAYDFAHKIYQFVRCKVFSKIKIIHNYYEQYEKQMKQLVSRALHLAELTPESGLYVHSEAVDKFFQINQQKPKSFKFALKQELYRRKQEVKNIQKISNHSFYLNSVFLRKMNLPEQSMVEKIVAILNSKLAKSKLQGGMIFAQIFKDIQLDDLSIYQNWYSYLQYIHEQMQFLFDEPWIKDNILTAKTVLKILELIHLFKVSRDGSIDEYVMHMTNLYGVDSLEFILYEIKEGKIKDYRKDYKLSNKIFKTAFSKLNAIQQSGDLTEAERTKLKSLINSVELLIAESYLKLRQSKNASSIISSIMNKFRQGQPTLEYILCQLLNAQCFLYQDIHKFYDAYQKTTKKADSFGLALRGRNVAESQYRIGEYLWESGERKQALDVHYRNAFEEFGSYMIGYELYKNMCNVWGRYSKMGLEQPKLKPNGLLKDLCLQNSQINSADQCYILSKVDWPNLVQLNLWDNNIGSEGSKYLSRAKWPKLKKLNLYCNRIGSKGCSYLQESQWPNLDYLVLAKNNIGSQGCKQISKAKWNGLNQLSLYENDIGDEGCKFLSEAHFPFLNWLNICNNNIGQKGCMYLVKAQWPNLVQLRIWNNSIGDQGCSYLVQSNWPKLNKLNLWNNKINQTGCGHLCKGKWKNLKLLNLGRNNIKKEDIEQLKNALFSAKIQI